MKHVVYSAILSGFLLLNTRVVLAQSITPEVLHEVTRAVIEICRGGTIKGENTAFEIAGKGDAKIVVIKRLAELGVNARVELSHKEWKGIRAAIPKQWKQSAYNECVNPNVRLFIDKLEKPDGMTTGRIKVYDDASSPICGGHNYVKVVVYKASARRPKQKIRLSGAGIPAGYVKMSVGESIEIASNCVVTLEGTGFDRDFYARLKYGQSSR